MEITLTDKFISGTDIDLSSKMLGVIRQPKLIDIIKNNINISSVMDFFILVEHTHWKMSRDLFVEHKLNEFETALSLEKELLEQGKYTSGLVHALSILYRVDMADVTINADDGKLIIFIKNREVIINDDNFRLLLDIVLGMFFIDKKEVHKNFERKWVNHSGSKYEEERIKKHEANIRKKEEAKRLRLSDFINIVVHTGHYSYDYVLSLTYWQLMNSYNALISIDGYNEMLGYTWSYKYDIKNDDNPHWIEKIKLEHKTVEL